MSELIRRMSNAVSLSMELSFFVRVIVACLCGGIVGIERSKRFKGAGIRTHCLVACASSIFMILSKYCFADLTLDAVGTMFAGDRGADPARIAAQVVSGIGFIGAGVIFKNGGSVKGLTTAAGIWATAAIGMSISSGMYLLGVFSTVVIVVMQILTHRFTVGNDSYATLHFIVQAKESPDFRAWLHSRIESMPVAGSSILRRDDGTITYDLALRADKKVDYTFLMRELEERNDVVACSCIEE